MPGFTNADAALSIRSARASELPSLTELCLRSKAYWGYDGDFIEACRAEFAIAPAELHTSAIAVAEVSGAPAGMAQVRIEDGTCDLLKLFVEPAQIGRGVGVALFDWAVAQGRSCGASKMTIESDPNAEPFYRRMGARTVGAAASGSIPGRALPLLELALSAVPEREG